MNGKTPKIHIESAKNRPNSNLRLENSRFRSLRSIFYEFRSSLVLVSQKKESKRLHQITLQTPLVIQNFHFYAF
jgi:hypothetical protein